MSPSPLMSSLRLLHGVLGFLVRQPEEQVVAFAEGHVRLAFVPSSAANAEPDPVPPVLTPVAEVRAAGKKRPAHPGRGRCQRSTARRRRRSRTSFEA